MESQELEESRQYLENFWTPAVGSNVRFRQTTKVFQIEKIEANYPEQVFLQDQKLAYAQDLEWIPTDDEVKELLHRAGINPLENGLQLGRTFRPLPNNYNEAADILRTYRQLRLLTDGVDPYLALK